MMKETKSAMHDSAKKYLLASRTSRGLERFTWRDCGGGQRERIRGGHGVGGHGVGGLNGGAEFGGAKYGGA